MAAKKRTSKAPVSKAEGRRRSKAMVSAAEIKKQMAAAREERVNKLGTGGESPLISVRGKRFTFQDADMGTEFNGIVVDYGAENVYYDSPYDPDSDPKPPACFAITLESPDSLEPHEDAPAKVAASCDMCEYNEFGSADNGRGKRCANRWRLALVHADDPEGPMALLSLSPSSYARWRQYVRRVDNTFQMDTFGVVTAFSFVDNAQPIVDVDLVEQVGDSLLPTIWGRRSEAADLILNPGYPVDSYEPPKTTRGGRGRGRSRSKM